MPAPQGPVTGTHRSARGAAGTAHGRTDDRLPPPRLTIRHGSAGGAEAPRRASAAADLVDTDSHDTDLVDTDRSPRAGDDVDWRAVGLFAAGIAIGAMLGAGAALLVAPASGFETRMRLSRSARRARERASDRWDDLENRARHTARRSRRNLKRRITIARWRAQDAWERKRYGESR